MVGGDNMCSSCYQVKEDLTFRCDVCVNVFMCERCEADTFRRCPKCYNTRGAPHHPDVDPSSGRLCLQYLEQGVHCARCLATRPANDPFKTEREFFEERLRPGRNGTTSGFPREERSLLRIPIAPTIYIPKPTLVEGGGGGGVVRHAVTTMYDVHQMYLTSHQYATGIPSHLHGPDVIDVVTPKMWTGRVVQSEWRRDGVRSVSDVHAIFQTTQKNGKKLREGGTVSLTGGAQDGGHAAMMHTIGVRCAIIQVMEQRALKTDGAQTAEDLLEGVCREIGVVKNDGGHAVRAFVETEIFTKCKGCRTAKEQLVSLKSAQQYRPNSHAALIANVKGLWRDRGGFMGVGVADVQRDCLQLARSVAARYAQGQTANAPSLQPPKRRRSRNAVAAQPLTFEQ